jgi:hypothetical protein
MSVIQLLISAVMFVGVMWVGLKILRSFAMPLRDPDAGELRKVNLRYRCNVCGTEIKMYSALADDPEPFMHCMEEMELLPPKFD